MLRTHLGAVGLHHVAQHEEGDVKEQGPNGGRLGWKREAATGATGQSQVTRSSLELVPLSYSNLHPSPLMCFGNSLSLRRQKKTLWEEVLFRLDECSTAQLHLTHLINLRAKDLSFPVAAAAASSRSRLFPDNMCPSTPRRPSGDLEWSASTVWWKKENVSRLANMQSENCQVHLDY